jgi:hypothetical protein
VAWAHADMCETVARYSCSKKDDQLVKEIEEVVCHIRLCCECCKDCPAGVQQQGSGKMVEPLHRLIDSLCQWEEGGMRILGTWAPRIVTLVSTVLRLEDRQRMDCGSGPESGLCSRSRKMKRLAAQGLWAKLPRSRATVLLLLEGDTAAEDEGGGRSKRRRVATVRGD